MSALAAVTCALLAGSGLDEARRHYQRLEYDQALAQLEGARREAGEDGPKLAQVWLLEGFVQLALGRQAEGVQAMRRAVRLDAKVELPADASPKLRLAFDEARRQEAERRERRAAVKVGGLAAAAPPVAQRGFDVEAEVAHAYEGLEVRLKVRDPRAGAEAALPMSSTAPGRFTARVPAELAAPGATLELRVEARDEGEELASALLGVRLPPHRAAIEVSSPHDGAEVTLDGAAAGTIPLAAALPVEPGARQLSLRTREGEVAQQVVVAPGEVAAITLKVAPGASARVRSGVGLVVASGVVLVGAVVFAVLSGVAGRQLEGAVRREAGSGLPLSDFSQVMGLEANQRAFALTAIVAAVVGAAGGATGAVLWFGGR